MDKKVAVFCNPEKPESKQALKSVFAWFKKNRVKVITDLSSPQLSSSEFAVVLGGDGTILRIARQCAPLEIPILGVNLGRLGFLAETDCKNLFQTLKKALYSELKVQERLMLKIDLVKRKQKSKKSFIAVNDCYLHTSLSSRVIEIETYINHDYLAAYVGDGLIISTPTGSTAYSLAASGPIVSPELPVILVTPICPHTLTQRPLVISDKDCLELTVKTPDTDGYSLLSFDGQERIKIHHGDIIHIETAPQKLKLLVDPRKSYYEILRTKLKWGER